MSEKIVLVHNNNGADWSFVKDRYVGHFRKGDTILLMLDGVENSVEIVFPNEHSAKAMGVNLNEAIQKAHP